MKSSLGGFLALVLIAPVVSHPAAAAEGTAIRVAVFNIRELGRGKLDTVDAAGRGTDAQLRNAAEIIQRIAPDVLLVNEIDFDAGDRANARLFLERYLRIGQRGQQGIDYPYLFFEAVNTGEPTGLDLDRDGRRDGPADCYGFGNYPGQYGMALYSRLLIDACDARTFRLLAWHTVPGHLMPDGRGGKPSWYSPEAAAKLRLSSKSHWDVPVIVGGARLHLLASHPTPPVFDGDEDRNGRRNFDEIRLWADYLSGGERAAYLIDDAGHRGALPEAASFVILGDLNADPVNDQAPYGSTAIGQLLNHPRVRDPKPGSAGGRRAAGDYAGPKELRTSAWGRLDYVLPSRDLKVVDAGVFWPGPDDPLRELVDGEAAASDHRLVWVDVVMPGGDGAN